MDFKQLVEQFSPKDYSASLDPEEKIEFDRRYGGKADETISFLAANKALPFQNDVESFEDPDFFTGLRRNAGFYTSKEKSLMKKQQRLIEGELQPIQQARQKIGATLALALAAAPETDQEVSGPVASMLGLNQPQAFAGSDSPVMASPAGLQPAPNLGVAFGQETPMMMRRPAPSMADQAMAALPMGTPGQMGALSTVEPFTDPTPAPGRFSQADPEAMQIMSGDGQLFEVPVRDQPIVMADRKQFPQPAPRPAPRSLSIPERLQIADTMKAQATGHLVPDETGKLVPASFALPDAKALGSDQQESLRRVMNGEPPLPGVPLPAAQFVAALKGRQEARVGSMPEIVKLQNQADQLPEGSKRRAQLEDRIRRLTTESKADIGEIAAAQAEFAALPPELQTSQNAALIAGRHKDVPTEEIMKGAKNPNQPLVNINTGVTASEEAQKEFMKSSRATFDQLKSAPTALRNIEEAKRLIPASKGFLGPGGEGLLSAAKFLNSRLGTKIDTAGVQSAEELRTRIFFNIMDNLKKMDAQPSQFQQQIMMDSLGKLGTDPNALSHVLDAFADSIEGKVEQHNAEVSSAEQRGVKFPFNPHITLPKRTKAGKDAASSQPATVANDADYDKLPSGSLFVGPDGKTRRKP